MDVCREYFELSQPQKSIWYLEQKYPDTCMNTIAGTLRFKGCIDYEALEKAIHLFIENNAAMRMHFREKDGTAIQFVTPFTEKKLDFFDFSEMDGQNDRYKWDEEQTRTPFAVYDSDLYYFAIVKIDENNGGFYAKLHHLISDAWTMGILGNEIVAYYSAVKNGQPLIDEMKPSFIEHLANEKRYELSDRFIRDREYWNKKFDVYPEPAILKSQALNCTNTSAHRKTFVTPQKLSDKIRNYCQGNNASVFTLFLSALSIYINRVTGNEDIILGTTILNRVNSREKDTTGMFVSVAAPIRIQMQDRLNFSEFTKIMLSESISILKHQKYPYNYLIRDLKKKHQLSNRLFDIVLNYQNSKLKTKESAEEYLSRWHFSGHQVESLVIHVNDRDDGGNYIINYDFLKEVYHVKEIEFLHQHVLSLLWHALDNPLRPIARLEMLSEKETNQILHEFNNTAADFPRDKTLQDFLYAQAAKTPENNAVIFEDRRMSYREINEKSNQLARVLREKGVKADTVVGISVFRSFEMIIGIMGILKAGGAYLPMDPEYPRERILYMIKDSGAQILLTQAAIADRFTLDTDVVTLDEASIYTGDSSDLENISGPHNLAYIIYTSGSTGKPKGVMIEHASIVNRINWMQKAYPIHAESTILQKTPFTFDVSVWELFWWTFTGAQVCMLEPGGEKDPGIILQAVLENSITTMHFVPSMLAAFLDYVDRNTLNSKLISLKQVFASGEALTKSQTDAFHRILFAANGTELYNLYGPTEAAVDVSYFNCSPEVKLKTVPIGKPIDNIHLYVLDRNKILLPVGIPGELYIGGIGVSRGYINNPDLTAEKFVEDPYNPGEILYKTGDVARWFPKGDIEYLGRMDFQIKIRGFRIELGEIENKLLAHSHVKNAVVVGRMNKNNSYLCAYYVADKEIKTADFKHNLSKALPEYMIPSYFVFMPSFPLSANGKIDRKLLPIPELTGKTDIEYAAPSSPTQKALALIWSEMLEIEQVGLDEDFFDIGGDSLRAISLSGEIQKKFCVELKIKDIFSNRTIRKMSAKIDESSPIQYLPIPVVEKSEYYSVSSAQKRLYILHRLDGEVTNYNLPGVLVIEGQLDSAKLVRVMNKIIQRHESLRTSFELIDGSPMQKIKETIDFDIPVIESDDEDIDCLIRSFVRPFDLAAAPLLRAQLITVNPGRHLLLFDMDHIISDGQSINILIREFSDLYAGRDMPDIRTQYKDYSSWQNLRISSGELLAQEQVWLNRFSSELPVLNMPTDFPRPVRKDYAGDKVAIVFDENITSALSTLASRTQSTKFMILLAAFNILLSRYSGQEDIVVGMPIAGRQHPDVNDLIGVFVNTLAIRNFPQWEMTFSGFLQEVKTNLLEAYENQDYPIERLVEKVCSKRDAGRNPIFDVAFIYQNMDISNIQADNLTFSAYEFNTRTAKFDISLEACEKDETILINAEYSTGLFFKSTIERMLSHFSNIVTEIIANQDIIISDIQMLSESEKNQLVYDFNDSTAKYPDKKTINQIFEETASIYPGNTALTFDGKSMSYGELNEKANILADIIRKKGIVPDDIVAVSVDPSMEMIIGIIGILKAGAAYLPMDPDFPDDRIRFMMDDSKAKILLTQKTYEDRFKSCADSIILDEPELYLGDSSNPVQDHGPSNLAYIIYTSGSTGKPKGVMIEHRNVVRLLFNDKFQFDFSQKDVWTLFHSFCFDFSVWEMYGALLYGGKLVIVKKQTAKDTRQFLEVLKKEKVSVLNQTPAAFNNLIMEEIPADDHSLVLRYVVFGGDALKPDQLKTFHEKYPETRLINMYGITETTVHVTYKEIKEEQINQNISNIGRAIPTLQTFIVDKMMNLVPIGVFGELCVSGAGLGRGYLNNPELTMQKFCLNPFSGDGKMYRSGDLAKVSSDGDIEYLGRIDNQLKIRGYRIELGEIESELLKHPRMKEVLVLARKNQYEENHLYAYFVSDAILTYDELKTLLGHSLPGYMIPSFFIQLDKMPLNRNGKIDRTVLPGSEEAIKPENTYFAPESVTQIMLWTLWTEVLNLDKIGIDEDFFSIGGESLSAIKLISKIPADYTDITLVDLYNNPTIRQLALKIEESASEAADSILVRLTSKSHNSKTPIICFPYGGGNVISYRNLSDSISKIIPEFELHAVNLPGHDMGEDEVFLSVREASQKVLEEIIRMDVTEIVLYGHCVGSAALIETARLLEKEKIHIKAIFIGATFPPQFVGLYGGFFDPWKHTSDEKIVKYLCRIGLPYKSFDLTSMGFIIKAFRHDVKAFYEYLQKFAREKYPRLATPIHFIVGDNDSVTQKYEKKYRKWLSYTNSVDLHVISGAEHYFINSHSQELAEIMKVQLLDTPTTC